MHHAARDADGIYPEGTINRLVQDRLTELSEKRRAFGARDRDGEGSAS